ncbi:MAG: cytidylate kinase family protein [Candidatus Micrarchaeota archaeon]
MRSVVLGLLRIAISGQTGCGNSTASELVSKKLKLKKFNYTFHDLARDLNVPFARLHELAELNPKYDFLLDKKQIEFALKEENCVVGTRLAVFLDKISPKLGMKKPRFDLKVWLSAPLKTRASRISERDGVNLDDALDEVIYRDNSNKERYKKLYGIEYAVPEDCLPIDNGNLDAKKTAALVISAAGKLKRKIKKKR